MSAPTTASLRRRPEWLRFEAAATLARTANEMFPVGAVLFVLGDGGGAALAGATVAAFALPSFFSGPALGAWLDARRRRERLLAVDQAVCAAALLVVALLGATNPPLLLAAAFAAGLFSPLSFGGFTALVPEVVRRDELPTANSVEAASFNVAIVAGPLLAGLAGALVDPAAPILVQAGLKLCALALVVGLRVPVGPSGADRPSVRDSIVGGLRHVATTRPLLAITAVGAIALAGRGLLTVGFPLFAVESLGESSDFGAYLWAVYALGSTVGIAAAARRQSEWRPEVVAIVATAVGGLVMLTWTLGSSPAVCIVLVAVAGAAYGPGLAATFAVRQAWTPPRMRGQVFATAASLKPGSFAIGAAVGGPLATAFGAATALVAAAGAQLVAAVVGFAVLRSAEIGPRARRKDAAPMSR